MIRGKLHGADGEAVPFAFSVDQLALMTTLSKAYLRKEIKEGRLKVRRFGRRVLIMNDDQLSEYLRNR